MTSPQTIIRELFHRFFPQEQAPPARADPLAQAYTEIAHLRETVFDLLVEVEAIRETLLKSPLGSGGSRSSYASAYRNTAFTTHNSAGCSGGHEKLMQQFYPRALEQREWRECLFMERLGFSPDEITSYRDKAEQAHTYT